NEKRGLKGILGVLPIHEHAPADPQHHRPMAVHQGFKRVFIAIVDESAEERRVRLAGSAAEKGNAAKLPNDRLSCRARHGTPSREPRSTRYYSFLEARRFRPQFLGG